ncbi:MAG: hypothetical protein K0S53_891 [Bacteroidetes bacterium]|jgi:hypothetical protein|nr:hypothetical protein [Bacteroidota bacterium]MDF2450767.1 hypothetical protein [Bacteroidota bacterium]
MKTTTVSILSGKSNKGGHSKSQEATKKGSRNNDLGLSKKTSTTDGGSKTDKARRK